MDEPTNTPQASPWDCLPELSSSEHSKTWSSATAADAFATALGITLPLQFQQHDQNKIEPEYRSIPLPYLRIGSHPAADIYVDEPTVKQCHAYLQPLAGHLFGMTFTSPTPNREGTRLKRWFWMRPAQTLRIGSTRIRLMREPSANQTPFAAADWNPFQRVAAAETLLPRLILNAVRGNHFQSWRMDRVLALVGNSDDATIRLRNESLTGFICCLVHTSVGVWVVDLLGSTHTLVNGEAIHAVCLREGDQLSIGDFSMVVHYEDQLPETVSPPCPNAQETLPPYVGSAALKPTLTNPTNPDLQNLVQQFGFLQQNLFEQFNQTMMLMFQMFNTLRQDQMQMMRQDLERVQRLLFEANQLRTLAEAPPKKITSVRKPAPSGLLPSPPLPQPKAPGKPKTESIPFSSSLPEVPEDLSANSRGRREGQQSSRELPPVKSDQEIHAWLSERLKSINQESQSRWQTLLNYFRSKD